MYAIIRMGKGEYYTSTVFAYYNNTDNSTEKKKRDTMYDKFYVVLDKDKKTLIKLQEYVVNRFPKLHLSVIIVDTDQSDWVFTDDRGNGTVNYTDFGEIQSVFDTGVQLEKFAKADAEYKYEPVKQIRNDKDIKDFMSATNGLHDGFIDGMSMNDGTLTVHFDGLWDCKLEISFSGGVEFRDCISYEESENYWFDANMCFEDGYVWLINDYSTTPKDNLNGFIWFKAREVSYRIIPK